MDPRKGEPTGVNKYASNIEGGKGGGERTGEQAVETGPRRGNSGAERYTGYQIEVRK